MSDEILLTQEGYDQIVAERDHLVSVGRKEVAEKLKEAISYGDLSENAEYDAAKNEQAELEVKIIQLEEKIRKAIIINENDATTAYLGITYSNNEEIILNTKLENQVNSKGTSITYSADVDDSKIENDKQKQEKLDKQLENSRSPYTRGSPIE